MSTPGSPSAPSDGYKRQVRITYPAALLFDEAYYPHGARGLWRWGPEYNRGYTFIVHPPLGKWLIAAGEQLFGYGPMGWRFCSAIAGTIAVVVLTRLTRRLPVLVSSKVKHGGEGEPLLIRTTVFDASDRRAYEQELLRLAPSGQAPLNRTMNLFLPLSAPADAMRWTLVVGTRLKQGGSVVEYPYTLPVQERRLPAGRL